MRPVDRGEVPLDAQGHPKVFSKYQDARKDLIDRLGEYCSYCEMHLDASLAVEHVQPKSLRRDLEREWADFLLSCQNCNSVKGNTDIDLPNYYWPDRDNTARVFQYLEGGLIQPHPALVQEQKEKAEATIQLTGLDRIPGNDPTASDRRWINRRDAWDIAVRSRERLNRRDVPEMREQITEHARAKGFWSVWMTVFRNDADMRRRFIEAFPGTAWDCFDDDYNEVPRPGGAI